LCLIAVAWKARGDLPLVVAANRDEWRERPAEPAHWWPDHPQLFAGRDLQAGGTWMGVTREGRFAAVTNFRDPADKRSTARSRGALVTDFLLGSAPPRAFLASLAARSGEYNGFNLILGDVESLWYFGSREGEAREIEPGIHGLSNHLLDEPWPKVVRARMAMEAALKDRDPSTKLFAALSDGQGAPDPSLPDTGVGVAWERRLASPLITGTDYGTRCSTVVMIAADGEIGVQERTRGAGGEVVGTKSERIVRNRVA
jgi:uncharacterized protein with NRDE domain